MLGCAELDGPVASALQERRQRKREGDTANVAIQRADLTRDNR